MTKSYEMRSIFGEFKTSMFRLAAEQLYRWEKWDIFSWDNIARMQEVEITSEFAQLMLSMDVLSTFHEPEVLA